MEIINNIVGGRYYVLEQIGKGGFSVVYKARDIYTKKTYALKKYITSDPANKKRLLEGMEKEVNVLKHCTHPVLPKIFNLIKEDGDFFLVMEYVEGTNLKQYLKDKKRLKTKDAVDIISQVCSGLYYLHSLTPPIIYRDLKPANIILKENGKVVLIDFGIAKRYNRDVADNLAIGSKGFAAPEQYRSFVSSSIYNTDIRTDIYTVGTTFYYLLTKKKYKGKTKGILSPKIKRIIRRCTKINPDERYQDCIELLCSIKSLHITKK